jgi:D-alanyl-D-alanine carboxypeptidase
MWERAFTPYKLSSGETASYGYGWETDVYEGRALARHNGGIPGFISEVVRVPSEKVYVVLLTNVTPPLGNPGFIATKIAAVAMGEPYREPAAITLDERLLDDYVGVYRVDEKTTRAVTREGTRLFTQRSGGPKSEIFAVSQTEFFYKDSFTRVRFERDASGKVTRMVVRTGDGKEAPAPKTDEAPPAPPVAVKVDPAILAAYVGEYELKPDFILTVTLEEGRLMTQATGQPKFEIFAKSETEFFPKVFEARITFVRGADGKVEKLVLNQGGRSVEARKR